MKNKITIRTLLAGLLVTALISSAGAAEKCSMSLKKYPNPPNFSTTKFAK